VMVDVVNDQHRQNANQLKEILATYRKAEDLINIGAYVSGSSVKIDHAIAMIDRINAYLRQDIDETVSFDDSVAQLDALFETAD
jgi:flagellum-specific ATP synthase